MPNSRIPSPAQSQRIISTPRKQLRRTRSVGSPARKNLRLSSIVESYKLSPVPNRQSILNDDTDIEMPRRGSWWKKIDDNSRDVQELLERKELIEVNNVDEEFDVEVLSQENKNYTLDLPESSDGESISSIVIPDRKLFTQKDHQPQIKFGQIKNNRETLQKLNKSYVDQDKEVNIGRKTLFCHPSKPRTKPVFPAALLNISANKTVNKTKEISTAEGKGQVRSLFGGRPGTKRKNMFADFIVSESEDEIPEIQPKVFGLQKRNEPKRRANSMSRHSPTSSIDLEMDDWRLLPSSTMVENQIEEAISPVKRIKLSNLLETKESEITTNSTNTINKTKQANTSVSSKAKSKNASNIYKESDKSNEINITPRNATANSSRVTRSMGKSLRENSITTSNTSKNLNKTKNQTQSNQDRSNEPKTGETSKNVSQRNSDKVKKKQNMLIDQPDPDEDFTLEYDNDNEVLPEIATSLKNYNGSPKNKSNHNVDVVEDQSNLVKKSSVKISKENLVEQDKSPNIICEKQEEPLLYNKQNNIESNEVLKYSKIQNNSQEIRNVGGLNKDNTNVQKLNKSVTKEKDKNKNKSIRKSVENSELTSEHTNEHTNKVMQTEKNSQGQSDNKDVESNENLGKSKENFNEGNPEDQEMESENEQNESNIRSEQLSDVEKETNESIQIEENNDLEIEEDNESEEINYENELHETQSQNENVTEEEANNEEQEVIDETDTDREKQNTLDDQRNSIEDSHQITLPNVSHDTTGRHRKKIKSPEVILHDKTKEINSFTVQGRNTSVRKTKSIIFHNKLETERDFRRSTGFSDATCNSSAEGSGWDSHRTTRKTLRQTFGKDFTPRKSLRALVMEKSAKLHANFTEVVDNTPQANSTEYDQVQDKFDSYLETELVQVEENVKMVQVHERTETKQIEEDQQVDEKDVSKQLEEGDKSEQLKGRDEMEQSELPEKDETEPLQEKKTMKLSKSLEKHKTEQFEEREEVEESKEGEEMEESEEGEEVEESEGKEMETPGEKEKVEESEEGEEMEESEQREEIEESEEREEMDESVGESEEREGMDESEEREEMDESEEREEMETPGEKEKVEESKEGEEVEESEQREEIEESEEREEMDESVGESEEREGMDESEEREEMDESEEREEMETPGEKEKVEESKEGEEMEESEQREEIEESEEREEMDESVGESEEREGMDESEEREEMDESEEREEMETPGEKEKVEESEEGEEVEESEEREEMDQYENEERDETEQLEEGVPDGEIMDEESDHEVSKRSRQTSLETYLQKIRQDNAEKRRKMQEELRNSLKNPKRDTFNLFKVPQRPVRRTMKIQKPTAKQMRSVLTLDMLPSEVIEDMKYKPPKRFQPNNASWITKRLYKFLENKLEPKYDYKARIRAEKLVQCIYIFTKEVRRHDSVRSDGIEDLKREMARLDVVKTHFDFYEFCHEFFPREIRIKVVPDIVNNISLPRHGVFSDILR